MRQMFHSMRNITICLQDTRFGKNSVYVCVRNAGIIRTVTEPNI